MRVFNFIFTFDFLSHTARKNPDAVIDAFIKAFGSSTEVSLLIKSVNSEYEKKYLDQIRSKIGNLKNIYLMNEFIDTVDLYRMIELSDCYISLHRSEGLGLGMAEAMLLGTLVVATGYSGNLSFMNNKNSLLVKFRKVKVGTSEYPYAEANFWAQPDIQDASELMKLAYQDSILRKQLVNQAKLDMSKYTNTNQRIWIYNRLKQI
jgi:glycosyltransferase involved in cell wall biosynthesis